MTVYKFTVILLNRDVGKICICSASVIYECSLTSDVLEHKWRASLKLHNCYMIDFNF